MTKKEYQKFVHQQRVRAWLADNSNGLICGLVMSLVGLLFLNSHDYFNSVVDPMFLNVLDEAGPAVVFLIIGMLYVLAVFTGHVKLKKYLIIFMTAIWSLITYGIILRYLQGRETLALSLGIGYLLTLISEAYKGEFESGGAN